MTSSDQHLGHPRPSMCTFSGVEFFPLDPRAEDVRVVDIAWALSMKCRYTGHTKRFYSVAEHSVLVSRYCQLRWPEIEGLAFAGLMHDAAEAYLPDFTGPVKHDPRVFAWFGPIEEAVERVVFKAVDLSYPLPKEVKIADFEIYKQEKPEVMHGAPWWANKEPDEWAKQLVVGCWYPDLAWVEFNEAFTRLST